jgi:hypothetical protein
MPSGYPLLRKMLWEINTCVDPAEGESKDEHKSEPNCDSLLTALVAMPRVLFSELTGFWRTFGEWYV